MRRYDWYAIAALSFCLILAGLALSQTKQYQWAENYRHYKNHTKQVSATIKRDASNDTGQSANRCEGTDYPNLSCEALSAQGAVWQVRDADAGTLIGIWQAVFGGITTFAAIGAAIFARDAATYTMRSAIAAEKALTDTNRPWLFISTTSINDDDWCMGRSHLDWSIAFTNYGKSPAIPFALEYEMGLTNPNPMQPFAAPSEITVPSQLNWGSRRQSMSFGNCVITPEKVLPIQNLLSFKSLMPPENGKWLPHNAEIGQNYVRKDIAIVLRGVLKYADAHGLIRETHFCLVKRHWMEVGEGGGRKANYRT